MAKVQGKIIRNCKICNALRRLSLESEEEIIFNSPLLN